MENECDQFDDAEAKYQEDVYSLKKENLRLKCQLGLLTPAQAVESLGDATVTESEFLSEFEKLAMEKNPNIERFDKPETPRSQNEFRNMVCEMKDEVESKPKMVEKVSSFSPAKLLNRSPRGSSSPKGIVIKVYCYIKFLGLEKTPKKSDKSCITQ